MMKETIFFGNSLFSYARAGIILIAGLLAVFIIQSFVKKRIRKNEEEDQHHRRWVILLAVRRVVIPVLYLTVLWAALNGLEMSAYLQRILRGVLVAVGAVLVVRTVIFILSTSLRKYTQKTGREEDEKRTRPLLSLISFLLWIIAALFLLDNFGFNISTLVAGLGVSGIAVAIAAQGILGDLFNYFVIFLDRPFELGDFIIFDDKLGSIEKIGIKTTRIRALGGEQLVVANSALVNARLHNYKRMERRRVVFRIGVTYQTPSQQLEEIPRLIREIIESIELTQFDRSHFQGYGDFALTFESVYYVLTADYAVYMDIQQEINLRIYKAFEERGIEFAYPTQTLYLQSAGRDTLQSDIGFTRSEGLPSAEPRPPE
ncbi:MAG: mechanosensitive ion channel family protein [Sediminispirochaetaceae bacterium]